MHIEYLLLRHDCVIVPGFGAFIMVHEAPIFDSATGLVTPMMHEVRFNSALRADDGMIASSYARKYGLTYREASELLTRDISTLNSLLEKEKEVSMGSLGIIRMSDEGNLSFSPFRSASKLTNDLGFHTVSFLKKEISASTPEETEENIPASNSTVSYNPDIEKKERKLDFNRNYYIPVNKIFAKSVASIALVLAVCLTILLPPSNRQTVEDRASVLPVDRIIETAIHTSDNTEEKEDFAEVPTNIKAGEESTGMNYYLIVGTFRTEVEAEKFCELHSACDYTLEALPSGKVTRVSAKKSIDREELQAEMRTEGFRKTFSESWIWEKD